MGERCRRNSQRSQAPGGRRPFHLRGDVRELAVQRGAVAAAATVEGAAETAAMSPAAGPDPPPISAAKRIGHGTKTLDHYSLSAAAEANVAAQHHAAGRVHIGPAGLARAGARAGDFNLFPDQSIPD